MLQLPRTLLALFAVAALIGCKSSAEPPAPEDSVFVATMGELRRIRTDTALDSAARDSAREATMRSHGVTAQELEVMARELAADPERATNEWREIERLSTSDAARQSKQPKPKEPGEPGEPTTP